MKIVIADPKNGKCYQVELDDNKSKPFYGLKIGSEIDGSLVGLTGCKAVLTGGSDKEGFPMRNDVHGTERKKIFLSNGPGFRKTSKGERRKKTVRGNVVGEKIAQINLKVTHVSSKSVAQLLGKEEAPKAEAPKAEAAPAEHKHEEKPVEKKEKKTKPKEVKENG